jgi:hypothetical protein
MFEVSEKQDFRLEQQEQSESDKSDDFIPSRSCVETKLEGKVEQFLINQPSSDEIVQSNVKAVKGLLPPSFNSSSNLCSCHLCKCFRLV